MPGKWTFLTNHAHVLLVLLADPDARLRDISARVGITERATQLIVRDLTSGGYVTKTKVGRRNSYAITAGRTFRHRAESDVGLDELLRIFRVR